MTPAGEKIVEQAQRVLEEASRIREIAAAGKDPLAGRCAWAPSTPLALTCCPS